MAGIHFDITGDNSNFLRRLHEVENGVKNTSKQIEQSGLSIEDLFNRMTKAAAAFGAGFTAKELISNIAQVRGEFQQLEVAFKTMLGSEDKANSLMRQLVKTAATTPFDLQGVANGAKQLLAYGENVENVNDDLIRLGNIAAGLSQPLNDLVYLYGTTMTQGRLYTVDLNQFTGRGIPMIRELAKVFGVAESEVRNLVESGKVGFPEVQKVIMSLTNEGGMFYNLMQEQSKTITGQISNIGDAISTMFNEIGKANEGIINEALSGVSYLVENYEKVGREIMSVVAAYGAYKAVLMSITAYQGVMTGVTYTAEIAELSKLIPVKKASADEDLKQAVASGKLSQAKAEQVVAMRVEAAAYAESLRLKAVEAKAKYNDALSSQASAAAQMEAAEQEVAAANMKYNAALKTNNARKIEIAETKLAIAESNRYSAAKALEASRTSATTAYTNMSTASKAAESAATTVNTAHTVANAKATNLLTVAKTRLVVASKALGLSLLANPYVIAAAAVAGLTYMIYKLVTAETSAEKAVRKHREEQEKFQESINERKNKIEELIRIVQDETETEYAKTKAYDELTRLSPALTDAYSREGLATLELAKSQKILNDERDKMSYDNIIQNINKTKDSIEQYKKAIDSLAKTPNSGMAISLYYGKIEDAESYLRELQKQLDEYNRLKKKAEEDAKTIKVKLMEAESNHEQIKQEFLAAKMALEEAQEELKNTPFAVIPIDIQLRFNNAQAAFEKSNETIANLKSSQAGTEKTYRQAYKEAEDAWKAKTKAVKDAKNKSKSEYLKAVKELEEAEKTYKELGGVTGSSLTKQENQAKKEVEEQRKQQEQLSEQLLSLRRKNQQDEINLMKEGSEKKLAQIDLDYQKELDAIEKQRDEWNKSQKGKLTDEQETQLFTSEENAFKIYEKNVKEVNEAKLEADRKAWQEYFIEFGNYQEKRKNLIQKYDDEIAKLQMDSPEYASKTAEKGQALEQLDEQFGKSTKAMADLFEDASNKSVSAIQSIIDKYETLVKYMSGTKKSDGTDVTLDELKSVGFTDSDIERLENGEIKIKDVIDAIKGLKNGLKEKSPWQSFRTELGKGIDTIKNADGDTQKLGQGITDIGNAVTSFIPALSEFGSNIANIFGVDDSKITGIIDAVGGLGQTAVGVGQIMSGDIFGGAMSAVSGISSIVSALDGLFGADYSHYNAMKERYDTLNEIWDELISKKKEYIDISYGTEALKAGEEALDIIKKSQDAQRNLARTLSQSGASAGSHSIAYRQNAALGGYASELYRYVRQNGNYNDITNALLGASAEQLQKVKEQMPELWAGLDGDFREHLNNIISGAEQAKEVLEQMKEAVAGISFDEFRSGYIDLLSDLDSTNEDFADNFEKYLQKSIFESLLANKYKERIQALYDTWVEYGKDGLTPDEVQKLRDMQEQLSESLLAERDKIMSDFGFTTNGSESKSSTSKGFSTMSQDTGEELSGRFTALQIAGEEIKNQMISAVIGINSLVSISSNNKEILDSILNQHVKTNNYLEDITKYAKLLNNIKNDISEVKSNTKSLSSR